MVRADAESDQNPSCRNFLNSEVPPPPDYPPPSDLPFDPTGIGDDEVPSDDTVSDGAAAPGGFPPVAAVTEETGPEEEDPVVDITEEEKGLFPDPE